jgi:hypothetical protein
LLGKGVMETQCHGFARKIHGSRTAPPDGRDGVIVYLPWGTAP